MKKRIFAIVMEVILGILTFASIILPYYFQERLTEETLCLFAIPFFVFGSAFGISMGIEVMKAKEADESATRRFLAEHSHHDDF